MPENHSTSEQRMVWAMTYAGCMATGQKAKDAASRADQAAADFKRRFDQPEADEAD